MELQKEMKATVKLTKEEIEEAVKDVVINQPGYGVNDTTIVVFKYDEKSHELVGCKVVTKEVKPK